MARFLQPPNLYKAVEFVHVSVDKSVDLALAEPLTGVGGTQLGVYVDNWQIAEIIPAAAQQRVSGDGLLRFQAKGKQQGICYLYARLGPAGTPWVEHPTQLIVETVLTTTRTPVKIGQHTAWLCWAAAAESFLQMQPYGARNMSQDELRDAYATWPDGALETVAGAGYSSEHTAEALLRDLGLTYRTMPGSALTIAMVEDKIRRDKLVILMYNRGAHDGHAVVVYGVRKPPPRYYEESLMVMDPENGGSYTEKKLSELRTISGLLVGWMD
jgi:hypothetical protein